MRKPPSAVQPQLALDDRFSNRGLFADHFLKTRLAEVPQWQTAEGIEEGFAAIRKLYREKALRFTDATNEHQTERDFIRPVLNILWQADTPGDCYQVQVSIPNLDARRQPDYAFFRQPQDRTAADQHGGTTEFWRDVPCLGDAKRWSTSLDKERSADENPSAQVANYLYRSRVRWGILTNGRQWRLYEQDKSRAGGVYFEVDLEAILQHEDREAFRYFWLFFRRQAHLPDPEGKTFLDRVFEGSAAYATEVQDSLKESVYDALRLLMTGFCEIEANGLDANDEPTRKLVHENCLILLYRLLFVLYAEDRRLLPHDDEHYEGYSLRALQQEINRDLRANRRYLPAGRHCWGRLCDLFHLIDKGFDADDQIVIPAYNGGLFSPSKHPHIAYMPQNGTRRWEIGDNRLAEVVDTLAYQRTRWDQPGTDDVDYATLAVQHLGSIYEGLLELQPQVAGQDLIEAVEDSKLVFKPAAEVPNPRNVRGQPPRRIRQGEVYLVTNRGERKATGSYYTPAYIVDYIVEHTVGPLAEEAAQKTSELLPQIKDLQARVAKASKPSTVRPLRAEIEDLHREQLSAYFSLKVLDPAMGSGHFLVGAADFLSLAMATDPSLPPVETDEEAQVYYKRLIVERCLYGVDLNSLAVELAKLSLWLHTVSRNKALSFLDHHLRCGNSLIGAWIDRDLNKEPPQFNARGRRINADSDQLIFGFTDALTTQHLGPMLDILRRINESPSATAQHEHTKEVLYEELEREREPLRQVAHCWLAPFFGVPVAPEQYQHAVDALREGGAAWQALAKEEWFQQAQQKAQDQGLRFFHWELEFLESFFTGTGAKPETERGFDAVIGNPPWVDVQQQGVPENNYQRQRYQSAAGKYDLYAVFLEKAQALCERGRLFSLITQSKFLVTEYGRGVRAALASGSRIDVIAHLADAAIFEGITTYPLIMVAAAGLDPEENDTQVIALPPGATSEQVALVLGGGHFDGAIIRQVPASSFATQKPWLICAGGDLAETASHLSEPFRSLFPNIAKGIVTCLDDAYLGTRDQLVAEGVEPELLRAAVKPRMLNRHATIHRDLWIVFPYQQTSAERITPVRLSDWPGAEAHFAGFRAKLEARRFYGKTIVEQGKSHFELPYISSYSTDPKIAFPTITNRATFCLDETGEMVFMHPCYVVPVPRSVNPYWVLAVLNSSLVNMLIHRRSTDLRGGYMEMARQYVEDLPIRLIDATQPTSSVDKQRLRVDCTAGLDRGDYALPLRLAEQALATHALLHGPAGKPELREGPYWAAQIAQADPDFPGREDFVHDLLAALAQRMMDLNRQKHEAAHEFLTWLEHAAGCEVDNLTNKTKLQAFWEHESQTLTDILRTNRRRCTNDPTTSRFINDFVREHGQAVATLTPLLDALQRTDDLIDQIVYRLYGLTDEEIAIVEG